MWDFWLAGHPLKVYIHKLTSVGDWWAKIIRETAVAAVAHSGLKMEK